MARRRLSKSMKSQQKALIYILFFVSGVTGLIYQVAWARMFITVFGNTTQAVSTVLAAFMGGLALGSIVIGKRADRFSRPIVSYGVLEVLIGAFALAFPWLMTVLRGLYAGVYTTFGENTLPLILTRFLLSFLMILIPTTLMGGTLPVLSRYAGRELDKIGKRIGGLYTVNTLGAVLGTLMAGFLLLEFVGVRNSVYLASVLSMVVGVVAVVRGRGAVVEPASGDTREEASDAHTDIDGAGPAHKDRPAPVPSHLSAIVLVSFAVSGAAALAYEVLYTRVLVFSLGTSAHAFSVMLTTFLVGIALGSFVFSRLVDRWRNLTDTFAAVELIIGAAVLVSIIAISRMDVTHHALGIRDAGGDLIENRVAGFLQAAIIIFVPTLFMGAAFPIVTRIYARTRETVSFSIGTLYFFNTLGAVAGALAAGFLLVPALGVARAIALMAAFNLGVGVLLLSLRRNRKAWTAASLAVFIGFVIVAASIHPSIFARAFNIGQEGSELLYFKEGKSGTVTVHRYPWYDLIAVDGVDVAGTNFMLRITQKLQAHLPVLLAADQQNVAHIGFGSGETMYILTLHDIPRIDGIEICPDIITAARMYFGSINHDVFDEPEVNIIIMDGKNYVLLTDETYDVIMTDSVYPGVGEAGSALYTYDHFRACRDKLKPGGALSCWLPLDMNIMDLKIALKAFHEAFPNMMLWYGYSGFTQHALLVGKNDDAGIDFARLAGAFRNEKVAADLSSIFIDEPYTLVSCLLLDGDGVERLCGDAPLNTDDRPILEFGIARRGVSKHYLSSNLGEILAYRADPMASLTNIEASGIDPGEVAAEIAARMAISDNIIRGHMHNAVGEAGRSKQFYEAVLAEHPENQIATRSIADLEEALSMLETAARVGGDRYLAEYKLGVRLVSEGRFEEALMHLETASELRPDLVDPIVTMGECYTRWGKPAEAVERLERARDMKPEDGGIYLRLGLAYEGAQMPEKALEAYEEAVKRDPASYEARNNLGNLLLSRGEIAAARTLFEQAQNISQARPHAVYNLGLTYAREGKPEQAAGYYRRAIAISPSFFPAHYSLGNALYEMGDREGAAAEWRKTLEIMPSHQAAMRRLQALSQ
jgi:spermidine synthase